MNQRSGAENGFIKVGYDLIGFRNDFEQMNPGIEVMGQMGWPSNGNASRENVKNLVKYIILKNI